MSIGSITGFNLPFDKITLDDISQKILIQLVSLLKDLSVEDFKIALSNNDEKLIRSGIQELIDKNYVKWIDKKITLNLTSNEIEILDFLNTEFIDVIDRNLVAHEFTIPLMISYFLNFLIKNYASNHDLSDFKRLEKAVYKQLERGLEKLIAFKFLTKKKVNGSVIYKLNLNFFYHTSKILKISYYLNLSLLEIKNNLINDEKITDLSLHNLNLYYLDDNNDKIDYYLMGKVVMENKDRNWFMDTNIKGNPICLSDTCNYGDYSILVFEGKKQQKHSMVIRICQDKIKHAIPLSRLPYMIGHLDRLLNYENRFYFKNLNLEEFNVTMLHYNFDFSMKNFKKYEMYMKEINKELTLGSYTNHFLFRFYQLIGDTYRFESQISKQEIPTRLKNILNQNESDPVFRTIRGLMKNSVDLINNTIEEEKLLVQIQDTQESIKKDTHNIKFQLRDYGGYTINKIGKLDTTLNDFSNQVNGLRINQFLQSNKVDDLGIETRNNTGLIQTSISSIKEVKKVQENNQVNVIKVIKHIVDLMDNNKDLMIDKISLVDRKLENSNRLNLFILDSYNQCDKETKNVINLILNNLDLDFPIRDFDKVLKKIEDNLETKKTITGKKYKILKTGFKI